MKQILVFLGLMAVLGVGTYAYKALKPKDDPAYAFIANGNQFVAYDVAVREQLNQPIVSAKVALRVRSGGWTEINSRSIRDICGGFLTNLSKIKEVSAERSDLARFELSLKLAEAGEKDDFATFPITVSDGSCVEADRKGLFYVGLMPPNADWQISALALEDDLSSITYTLDPIFGVDYKDAIASFDPLSACQSILAEVFESEGIIWPSSETEVLVLKARNFRGNSILNFSTSKSWEFSVAGSICANREGSEA